MTKLSPAAYGVLLAITAAGCTSTIDAFAKLLASDLHGLLIVWGYAMGIATLVLPYLIWRDLRSGTPGKLYLSRQWPLQLLRAACLIGSIGALFLSLTYVPLVDATVVMFTHPLFVNLLAGPVLGERVSFHRWLGVLAGLTGVLIILRPGSAGFSWPILYSVLAALFFALFQLLTRALAATQSARTTLFYTAAGGTFWSTLLVGFVWQPLTLEHAFVFLGLGALGVGAHVAYIKAYEFAQVSFLAPFSYSKVLWTTLLGYLFFADVPSATVLTGAAFIVGGGLFVFWRELKSG